MYITGCTNDINLRATSNKQKLDNIEKFTSIDSPTFEINYNNIVNVNRNILLIKYIDLSIIVSGTVPTQVRSGSRHLIKIQ